MGKHKPNKINIISTTKIPSFHIFDRIHQKKRQHFTSSTKQDKFHKIKYGTPVFPIRFAWMHKQLPHALRLEFILHSGEGVHYSDNGVCSCHAQNISWMNNLWPNSLPQCLSQSHSAPNVFSPRRKSTIHPSLRWQLDYSTLPRPSPTALHALLSRDTLGVGLQEWPGAAVALSIAGSPVLEDLRGLAVRQGAASHRYCWRFLPQTFHDAMTARWNGSS